MNLPNRITIIRIFLIPVFMLFAVPMSSFMPEWFNEFINNYGVYLAIGLFAIAALTDSLDGYLARKRNEITKLGKFMDPIADKLLVIAALVILVEKLQLSSWIAMIIIAREIIVMGIRIVAAGEGVVIAANIWGKVKTNLQIFAIIAFMLSDIIELGVIDDIIMGMAVIATIYSGYIYLKNSLHIILDK